MTKPSKSLSGLASNAPSGPKILVCPLYLSGVSGSMWAGVFLITPSCDRRWKGARTKVPVSIAYAGDTMSELESLTLVKGSGYFRLSLLG